MATRLDKNRIYAEIVLWSRVEIKQIKRPLEQVTCEPMLTSYTPALVYKTSEVAIGSLYSYLTSNLF